MLKFDDPNKPSKFFLPFYRLDLKKVLPWLRKFVMGCQIRNRDWQGSQIRLNENNGVNEAFQHWVQQSKQQIKHELIKDRMRHPVLYLDLFPKSLILMKDNLVPPSQILFI